MKDRHIIEIKLNCILGTWFSSPEEVEKEIHSIYSGVSLQLQVEERDSTPLSTYTQPTPDFPKVDSWNTPYMVLLWSLWQSLCVAVSFTNPLVAASQLRNTNITTQALRHCRCAARSARLMKTSGAQAASAWYKSRCRRIWGGRSFRNWVAMVGSAVSKMSTCHDPSE